MAWFNRLANIFRPDKLRGEIDEELRYHIHARMSDSLARGMTSEEARRDALRRFGGQGAAVERSRDADIFVWVETIIQDLRYGLRSLHGSPGVAAVALVSLALAMGANTAIFSVVNAVLLRSLPYKDPERIAIIWVTNTINGSRENHASVPNFEDWKARSRAFQDLAMYREADASFTLNGEPDWIEFAMVYGDFFRLLGRSPVLGRVFSADNKDAHEVVLSHRLWRTHFGASPDAIGRTVNVSGFDFQVIGVMPEDFSFPLRDTQLWMPANAMPDWKSYHANRQGGFGAVAGRIRPGVTMRQARVEMQSINRQLAAEYPKENEERGINIVPLAAQINGKTIPFMLAVLFGAVVFVLLIACANVANLLLARGAAREREIALRSALGAGRTRILRQLLTESLLLSTFAGLLALPLAAWGIQALLAMAPGGIARLDESHIDARVLVFSLALSFATGILFGLAPAIRISRQVNSRQTVGFHSRTLGRVFVVAEVALAVVLLTGAGLLIRSFAAVQSVDPGFRTDRVLTATLRFRNTLPRAQRAALYREAMSRIEQLPGVRAAGGISEMFYTGDQAKFGLRSVEGRPAQARDQWTPMTWSTIGGDYFQALGLPLLRGRYFNDRDTADAPPVVIINETMARRYWPGEDPIGTGIKGFDARGHNDEWVRVVGVVKDMRSRGLERAPMAQIYEAQTQSHDETENLVVRTDVSARVLRDTIRSIDKTAVWSDVSTLQNQLHEQNAPRRFQTLVVSLFAGLALALAAAGIFGTMHFAVAQRTREIGIRMAMGARPAKVLHLVMREGCLLAVIGTAAGLAGSLALTRSIRTLLFEVGPSDPVTLISVSLLLTSIALIACYIPARRATRVDPMMSLRCE
jgi:predicted permease